MVPVSMLHRVVWVSSVWPDGRLIALMTTVGLNGTLARRSALQYVCMAARSTFVES